VALLLATAFLINTWMRANLGMAVVCMIPTLAENGEIIPQEHNVTLRFQGKKVENLRFWKLNFVKKKPKNFSFFGSFLA
jgi:hypothetical protein